MSLLDIIQSVGIIASFLLALVQLRVYAKSLQASSHTAILSRLDSLNRLLFENPQVINTLKESHSKKQLTSPKMTIVPI